MSGRRRGGLKAGLVAGGERTRGREDPNAADRPMPQEQVRCSMRARRLGTLVGGWLPVLLAVMP